MFTFIPTDSARVLLAASIVAADLWFGGVALRMMLREVTTKSAD